MGKENNAIVLFSGGLDSTIALCWALEKFEKVTPVIFNYGQINKMELVSAWNILIHLGVNGEEIDLRFVKSISKGAMFGADMPSEFSTFSYFVPFRNPLFLTVAGMLAVFKGAGNLVIGVTKEGWLDCHDSTPTFMDSMENMLHEAMGSKFNLMIHAPFMYDIKSEVIKKAKNIKGAWELLKYTRTCLTDSEQPCGVCEACKIREKGFKEAEEMDPIWKK